MALVRECTPLYGWHNTLGHRGNKITRKLVMDFHMPVSNNTLELVCGPCQIDNSHHLPLVNPHVWSSPPFELVY